MVAAARVLAPPLCVDLDGALIKSDPLLESLLLLIRRDPLNVLRVLLWALRGRAVLKAQIAARVTLNAAALPYNIDLLSWLRAQHSCGRELWLCTATDQKLAALVAEHLGIFSGVIASDRTTHLERVPQTLLPRDRLLPALWRALRPHQWAKNVLIFVPLLAAHRAAEAVGVMRILAGFVALCLCASSVYVLNDMLDLEADRGHARKSRRPFASGALPLAAGFALFPGLLAAGALVAACLPAKFQIAVACYYGLTCAYSFVLKRFLLLDAVALAGLYTLRIIAGAGAAAVPLSFWLLLFSVFLFLSLAFVKRYAELDALRRQQRLQALGRGYRVEDLAVLQSFGTAAGYLSVLVLALYINSPDIQPLYHHPKIIWALCVLVLYWISRVWMTAHRGGMHDDPVVYALRDRVSLGLGVVAALVVAAAL